jgi:hypothetical protein
LLVRCIVSFVCFPSSTGDLPLPRPSTDVPLFFNLGVRYPESFRSRRDGRDLSAGTPLILSSSSSSPRSICTPADFMFWSPAGHGAARLYRPDPALRRRSSPVVAACLCEGMEAQAETSKAGSFDLALSCLIYLVLTFVLNRSIQSSLCLLGVIWSAPLSGLPRSKEDLSPYLDPSSVRSTFCNAFYSGSFEQLNGGTVRTLPPT